ncbi:MAG: peroxiredoxin [Verrucomicrobiota bacterium]
MSFFSSPLAPPLAIGSPLPEKNVTLHDGTQASLVSLAGGPRTLFYFFPKAGTPVCTAQACSFRDEAQDLADLELTVLGISGDSPAALARFREKRSLPFSLISDEEGELASAFGVSRLLGWPARKSFLFQGGHLVWKDTQPSPGKQVAKIRQAILMNP